MTLPAVRTFSAFSSSITKTSSRSSSKLLTSSRRLSTLQSLGGRPRSCLAKTCAQHPQFLQCRTTSTLHEFLPRARSWPLSSDLSPLLSYPFRPSIQSCHTVLDRRKCVFRIFQLRGYRRPTQRSNATFGRRNESTKGHSTTQENVSPTTANKAAGSGVDKFQKATRSHYVPISAQKYVMDRLSHMPHLHRPTKEDLWLPLVDFGLG